MHQPSALFYPNPHTLALLGDHVPYLACPIKEPSLLTALGVITEVTWRHVLHMLTTWSTLPAFKSSPEHMSKIYTFLATAMEREPGAAEAICSAFAQSALIWLPAKDVLPDATNATAADTPFMHGTSPTPYQATPQSTRNRKKSRKKVGFTTPGMQARRGHSDTPAAPAYTPYTLTPGWTAPAASRRTQGHFYAATGDSLRLWDPTGVVEGVPSDKLGIRILSDIYSSEAVMSFFAEGLVNSSSAHSSPIRQFEGVSGQPGASAVASGAVRLASVPQQPQQQTLSDRQTDPQAETAANARPARAAPNFDQEDYIDLISSEEDEAAPLLEQDQNLRVTGAADDMTNLGADAAEQHQPNTATAAADAAQVDTRLDLAQQEQQPETSQPPPTPASPLPPSPLASEPQSMILSEPTCKDYCQALAAVAEPVPPALYSMQLNKLLAILNRWAGMISESTMGDTDIDELRERLKDLKVFPIAGQAQWASLSDGLILNDEPALACLFEGAKGVALLHLPNASDK